MMILDSNELLNQNSQYQEMVLGFIARKRLTRRQFSEKIGLDSQILQRFLSGKTIGHYKFLLIIKSVEKWEQMPMNFCEQVKSNRKTI